MMPSIVHIMSIIKVAPREGADIVRLYLTSRIARTVRDNVKRLIKIHEEQSEAAYRKRHDHQIASRRIVVKRAEIARQERCR